jgi:hypothetical protein
MCRFVVLCLASAGLGVMLLGCAVATPSATQNPACSYKVGVLPASATADHSAAAPGNQQQFDVGYVEITGTCPIHALEGAPSYYTWVSSDPVNAPISNATATAGIATCVGTTTVPATISVSSTANVATATLTCK